MAATIGEIERIIMEMNQLFPNLIVKKDDLLNPKHEFVKSFCEHAVNYYDSKIGFMVSGEEAPLVNTAEAYYVNLGYGPEIALYIRIRDITQHICTNSFTVIDFYRPQKQRTKAFLRIILNFLLYVDNRAQHARNIVEHCMGKIDEAEKLQQGRNAALENINQKAKDNVTKEETLNKLQAELSIVNKAYQEMLELKKERNESDMKVNIELQKYEAIIREKTELLNRLMETEKDLREKLVSSEEVQTVNEMEEQLEDEKTKINSNDQDYAATLKSKQEDCDFYADALAKINSLDFDCFGILKEVKNQQLKIKEMEQKCGSLSAQIQTTEKEIFKTKSEISSAKEKKQQLVLQKEKIRQDIVSCTSDQKIKNEAELNRIRELKKECEEIKEGIGKRKELLKRLHAKKDLLTATFEEQYRMMLEVENKVVTSFNKTMDILCEELRSIKRS